MGRFSSPAFCALSVALAATAALAWPNARGRYEHVEANQWYVDEGVLRDYDSDAYVYSPDTECCSDSSCNVSTGYTRMKWTRERLAELGGAWVAGGGNSPFPTAGTVKQATSSCVGLYLDGGPKTIEADIAFREDVNARAAALGKARPLWLADVRPDIVKMEEITASDDDSADGMLPFFSASWVLRMGGFGSGRNRTWANFTGWYRGAGLGAQSRSACDSEAGGANDGLLCGWSHCRFPYLDIVLDLYSLPTTVGCQKREADGYTLYTTLVGKGAVEGESLLGQKAAYYIFYRDGASAKVFYPNAVGVDMSNASYVAWRVQFWKEMLAESGWDAVHFTTKIHWFAGDGTFSTANEEPWPDMGDGNGGCGTTLDHLTSGGAAGCTATNSQFSGPLRLKDGTTYGWTLYAKGLRDLGVALRAAGVPYAVTVRPNYYRRCTNWRHVDSDYDDPSCDDSLYDDPASGSDNEAAYIREWVQNATYVLVDQSGPRDTDFPLGQNGGSWMTGEHLRQLIMEPAAGVPRPTAMRFYNSEAGNTSYFPRRIATTGKAVAPKVFGITETNPDSAPLTIAADYCGNGEVGDAEECDDGNTTDGDGCTSLCSFETCGDGGLNPGEECDDGNTTAGDGCDASCQTESVNPITSATITATCADKTSGVQASPYYCHFSATATHSDSDINANPFLFMDYAWYFGDVETSGTGNWDYGRQTPKNYGYGPETGHAFECYQSSCTYNVQLSVKASTGTRTATTSITIIGEDEAYTGTNTRCVSTSGTFTGCPVGATRTTSSDFDAYASTASGIRTLFRCGETFTMDADVPINTYRGNAPLWGAYEDDGAGPCSSSKPIVNYGGSSTVLNNGVTADVDNYRFRDLRFVATSPSNDFDANGAPNFFASYSGWTAGARIDKMLWLRVDAIDVGRCPYVYGSSPSGGFDSLNAYIGGECKLSELPSGGWPMFWSFNNGDVIGSKFWTTMDMTAAPACPAIACTVLGFRTHGFSHASIASNTFDMRPTNLPADGSRGGGFKFSFRTCAESVAANCTNESGYLVVADNLVYNDGNETGSTMEIVNSHNASDVPNVSSPNLTNAMLARNLITFGGTVARGSAVNAITFDGVNGLLADSNIVDFRALPSASANTDYGITQVARCSGSTSCDTDDSIYVQHNDVIGRGTSVSPHAVAAASLTSASVGYCANNVVYDPSSGKTTADTDPCAGTWTAENPAGGGFEAASAATCPFDGTTPSETPGCTLTAAGSGYGFSQAAAELGPAPNDGGTSIDNDGYDFGGGGTAAGWSFYDFVRAARPATGRAIGALQ